MPTTFVRFLSAFMLLAAASACARTDAPTGINDPFEATNRRVHEFNKDLDTAVIRPVAIGYGQSVPRPVRGGIANLGDYLRTPRYIVNDIAQGNIGDAGHNFTRLALNTVFGFGILDPATDMGVEERPAGFGDTLAIWGVGEGAYVELPVLGPSTTRDAVGVVVDFFSNPVSPSLESSQRAIPPTLYAFEALDTRNELRTTIDGVLYESTDSYATSRDIYLQNRRFELGQTTDDLDFDPYAEFDPYPEIDE